MVVLVLTELNKKERVTFGNKRRHLVKALFSFYARFNLNCYHPPDKFSLSGHGVGNCLTRSCPVGGGLGQIKINFPLILRSACYFFARFARSCATQDCVSSRVNAGIGRRVVEEQ